MSLGELIPDLQFLIPMEGVGRKKKNKQQRNPSCFQGTRCNSDSVEAQNQAGCSWEGVFFMFSLFPRLCHNHFTRRGQDCGEPHGLNVAVDATPLCPPSTAQEPQSLWHCWEPEDSTAAQQCPGPLPNIPSLLSRVVWFQRNSGKMSETIRENGETAQSNLAKINTNQKPNKAKNPHLNKQKEPNIQPTSPNHPIVHPFTHPTESTSGRDYFTQASLLLQINSQGYFCRCAT